MRVSDAASELNRLGGLFASAAIRDAENAALSMNRIEFMSDADIPEVQESAELFTEVESTTADLRGLLDFLCGKFWLTSDLKKGARAQFERPIMEALAESPDDAYALLSEGPKEEVDSSNFGEIWRDATSAAKNETFLHWEVAFPGVWSDWLDSVPQGGFDAIIGNPPWDRIKLQEVEWFATRAPDIARATTADARRSRIRALRRKNTQLAEEYDNARVQAERLSTNVRNSGHYPLLARGDINLYSLFVERATHLIKPDGFVGLLTPSGMSSDQSAGNFFRSVSTAGRVAALFDFINGRMSGELPSFFPDVHLSFKFCVMILGGVNRRFDETLCGFFLQDPTETDDPDRCFPLSLDDFTLVNPNTGTAPIFRSRRDAEITRHMYESHPVLVDRSGNKERRAYSFKYLRMIDMTNDSGMFRSAEWLKSEGFYPVGGNCWKRRDDLYLPLYEGKMVQAYDHRAARVILNPENLNRPAQAQESTEQEHEDVSYLPAPLHWVKGDASPNLEVVNWMGWTIGFKDVTAPTNIRTMIASVVPLAGFGNTLPILTPVDASESGVQLYKATAPYLWQT